MTRKIHSSQKCSFNTLAAEPLPPFLHMLSDLTCLVLALIRTLCSLIINCECKLIAQLVLASEPAEGVDNFN